MTDHDDASDGVNSLTESQRHELLANEMRREALEELADATAPLSMGDLAEDVVARREGGRTRAVSNVQIELHHRHLPTLDSQGLLQYDPSTRRIVSNNVTEDVFDPLEDR